MGRMTYCCLMHPCIASSDRNRNSKINNSFRSIEFKINICVLLIVTWCSLVSLKSKCLGPIYPLSSASIIGTYTSVSSSPSSYYNSSNFETETLDSDSVSVLIVFIDNDEAQLLMAKRGSERGEQYKKYNCGHNHRIECKDSVKFWQRTVSSLDRLLDNANTHPDLQKWIK